MSKESEEKQLPASAKKLREARRKGQVSHSRDLISGVTFCAAFTHLLVIWPTIHEHLSQLIHVITALDGSFEEIRHRAFNHVANLIFLVTAPLVGIVVVFAILFGMIATGGPVFSFEPIKPKLDHVNPVNGFKKIASLRNFIEFIKGLTKVIILAGVFVTILLTSLQPLFNTPGCGETCVEPMVMRVLAPIGIAAALAFIIIGVVDVPIQRWLHLRDMRMTRTEFKRERKDTEGDPHIRQQLRRDRREIVEEAVKRGVEHASIVFTGSDCLVALRYFGDETPVPIVVEKSRGASARLLSAKASTLGIPIVADDGACDTLFRLTRMGASIGPKTFPTVIPHLIRLGLA